MKVDHKSFVEVVFDNSKAVRSFIDDSNLSFVDHDLERAAVVFADDKDFTYDLTNAGTYNAFGQYMYVLSKSDINIADQRQRKIHREKEAKDREEWLKELREWRMNNRSIFNT